MTTLEQIELYISTTENNLLKYAISDFIKGLALNYLSNENVDLYPISDELFLDKNSTVVDDEIFLDPNDEVGIKIEYTAYCNWEYSLSDERDVGLYGKGDIIGCKDINCDIKKIELFLFDGSTFDLTDQLYEYVLKKLLL